MAATSNRQMAYLKFNAIIALIQLQVIPTYIGGEALTSSGDGYLPAYCIYFCRKPVSSVHRIWNSVYARRTTYIATASCCSVRIRYADPYWGIDSHSIF